ncbi:MAG: phosphoenolpyruvate--protein phosphotransferase [Pseudomonadota bacterium]|nr:phosphoenolpyruvate--protein phosphotransferase [Pseudomonadota bacterium]
MLDLLQRIIQEVNSAADHGRALEIIVRRVKRVLHVDVCSVFLVRPGTSELLLMATDGLNPECLFNVRIDFNEGLVGLVAQRAEPINLEDAPRHPRYKYFPQTGEERYRAFLGIPIVQHRKLLGVLVVQQREQRRFDDEHTAFLITLAAQLAGTIIHAELSGGMDALRLGSDDSDLSIRGVEGAPGVAIGTAWVAYPSANLSAVPDRVPADIKAEVRLFQDAVQSVQTELLRLKERMGRILPAEERALFDAYIMILGSDALTQRTVEGIRAGKWAPAALRDSIAENASVFDEMDDAYLRERGEDIRDLGRRLLMYLEKTPRQSGEGQPSKLVLVGENVSVAELADIDPDRLMGVISGRGSASSHVAILARALEIPAVMGAVDLPYGRLDGREVIVDGYTGRIYLEPGAQIRVEYERLQREEKELSEGLAERAAKPAFTPDGERVPVYVNSGLLADINVAFMAGSDGVGLYRTEFPFMVRDRFPGEQEQTRIYRQVLESVAPRPVTLRTLDVGGDKTLPYFPIEEDNPFLGWRGIRITLDHPEIFLTQVRAMLRANVGLNNLKVMFPMISAVSEVDEALALVRQAWSELVEEGVEAVIPEMGVMIEVPSAVYMAQTIASRVAFVSVGTNDLVQYLLAVDRNNAQVADLYRTMHPAVLRALIDVVHGAHAAKRTVGVCGEMASDPASAILLLGMGMDNLSVTVSGLSRVKWMISSFTRARSAEILESVLKLEDPVMIRETLNRELVRAGLGGLVRAGKR